MGSQALESLPSYSVLMAVYQKENPRYFDKAIRSMLKQSVVADDFVIVCDGPLTDELNFIIQKYQTEYPYMFQILRIPTNKGLGNALNAGIKICRNDLIARMDSDDISRPKRCEWQLKTFMEEKELALCSGDIEEFETKPHDIQIIRHVPETYEEIVRFAKKKNPMNHMAVMCRKSAVEDAGGYIEVKKAEDYYLWVRMLQKGFRARNLNHVLVDVRIGDGMYKRRGGMEYAKASVTLQKEFLRMGFISPFGFMANSLVRIMGSLMPEFLRKFFYRKRLRKIRRGKAIYNHG